ncbi:hypothetical protein [Paracoccus beibuensis]|uniref:hypothetical protein n=1 Tax=Paracoccus beibuensis TaxID=547602 RepID=UPI00223F98C0|nr:hypothetical protein [Paracoccus beibuensis]
MTIPENQRQALIARLNSYSIGGLLRLSNLAFREEVALDREWAALRMTDAQRARWQHVRSVRDIVDAEADRRLSEPIRRTAS